MGPKIVVVTDGAQGVYAATDSTMYYHPAVATSVVDTLGAGDSFGSCFIATYLKTNDIEKALRFGNLNSASVIRQIGAKPGLLTWKELEEQDKKIPQNLSKKFTTK